MHGIEVLDVDVTSSGGDGRVRVPTTMAGLVASRGLALGQAQAAATLQFGLRRGGGEAHLGGSLGGGGNSAHGAGAEVGELERLDTGDGGAARGTDLRGRA
eukprot:scaffold7863_cov118-Isochrysis_galbana.AAC.6